MEFISLLKNRGSARKYLSKAVSEELINELIEQANTSPSAGNIQARKVIIVNTPEIINQIIQSSSGMSRFEGDIPVLLVILANSSESGEQYKERGKTLYALQDATIFTAYLQLLIVNAGLATRWVGSFDEANVSQILKIPEEYRPIAILPVGYSEEVPEPKERKRLEELILKKV